ncbi:MAG: hypothetical protein IH586_02620, partial [Anaerolineaceae bacterium]|nr:hypothetical protein [Anaerolineaceae bacterium]
MAKHGRRLSRWVVITLVVFCLGAFAGLLALQTPRGAMLFDKASQRAIQALEELYNKAYFGLNPGTPVTILSTVPVEPQP